MSEPDISNYGYPRAAVAEILAQWQGVRTMLPQEAVHIIDRLTTVRYFQGMVSGHAQGERDGASRARNRPGDGDMGG